jgi:hypothetical protein
MKKNYLLVAMLFACAQFTAAQAAEPAETPLRYDVTALIQDTNRPWGKEIILEGFPTAVCKRSGKKAWLHDVDSESAGTVRVERTGSMAAFTQDAVGKTMRVTGTLRELRMDAAYFDAWEARVKESLAVAKNKNEGEKEDGCTEQCQENVAAATTLKNIAAYRAKVAKTKTGYLSAMWVDGTKWELIEAKAEK